MTGRIDRADQRCRRTGHGSGRSGLRDRLARRRERLVGARDRAYRVGRDDPEMVGRRSREPRHRGRHALRARPRSGVLRRRLCAVARARAVLEGHRGRLAVRIDGAVERGARVPHARCGFRHDRRRRRRHEGVVGAAARTGVTLRNDAEVVGPTGSQPGHRRRDRGRSATGPGVLHRGLLAVARARAVVEVPRRRTAARVDRPVQGGRRRRDAARAARDSSGDGRRREDPVRSVARTRGARRHEPVVVRRPRLERRERRGDGRTG